jgi:hypothetical protein
MGQQADVDVCLWTVQVEQWPEDEGLFALYLEVHRRRDKIALHMLPLALSNLCNTSNSFPDIPWNYGRAPAWRGLLFLCVVFGTIATLFCVPFVN